MRVSLLVVLLLAAPVAGQPPRESDGEKLFRIQVLPVLKEKCFACHGDDPKKQKGGLDLRTAKSATAGGDSGQPALVPGKPDESPLYLAVTRTNDRWEPMPPKENDKLTAAQVEAIRDWIKLGAPWPDRAAANAGPTHGVAVKTSGGLSADWTNRKYDPANLWAYQPVRRPAVPEIRNSKSEIRNPVDAFIQAKLDVVGLAPAPRADKLTLIRRATFDLLGLPPTPEEIDAFLKDDSPDAYEKLIDRLLASPHYGEQWGRHWLDVARYADSSGLANDYERGNAWRYRDYVVRSFNADKPYDRFVREQIAGDEIDPAQPEMLVAVGFLRGGPWELTGMEVPRVARQRFLDDVTDAVGQVFLAHALQCARCHDHKFDPVPTRDYYRVQAAFATTQLAERPAPFLPAEKVTGFEEKKYLEARRARYEQELERIRAIEAAARKSWETANPDKKGQKPPRHEFLTPADLGLERIARKGLERLRWELDRFEPVALSVYSGKTPAVRSVLSPFRPPTDPLKTGTLDETHILAGGDPFSPKEKVTPGVLSAAGEGAIPESVAGRRKALADWIADPKNPLTARVMVNRVWSWHFGRGLAGNPNNFGATGKKPTHPELLDWLAAEFMDPTFRANPDREGGGEAHPLPHGRGSPKAWSVKHLHRLIMTSEAYRRASRHPDPKTLSAKDPDGTTYASFQPRRLAAEELRDAMLAVSGELNREVGGIPVRPEIHPEVALQPRQVMGTFAPAWQPSPRPEQRNRRTMYALKLRGLRDPFLEVFNQPGPDSPCELRESSTVTPQAFALMNGESTRARALAFALRLLRETNSNDEAIERAFRLAFGRAPTDAERAACLKHWAVMTERHKSLTLKKPERPSTVERVAVEENTGETFTFTEVLDSAADFVPDAHPADASPECRGLMEVCLVLLNANEFAYVD
jgi:mono/diheme cytochrome c family protein